MIFKRLACWRLAVKYGLPCWNVLLPTGCDCILEGVFEKGEFYDEFNSPIEIVSKDIQYILGMAIPLFGIIPFVLRIIWRYKVLYHYLVPMLYPDMNDWTRLLYVFIPTVCYIKVWRDSKC